MFDRVDNVIEAFIKAVEQVHYQCLVAHRSLNILEKIRDGLETLRVLMNGQVAYLLCSEIIVQLDCTGFFVVFELIFNP